MLNYYHNYNDIIFGYNCQVYGKYGVIRENAKGSGKNTLGFIIYPFIILSKDSFALVISFLEYAQSLTLI